MFHDDCVGSCESIDQVWCAMLLVNDPNAELVGTLRPPREDVSGAVPSEVLQGRGESAAVEEAARWRSRTPLWVASGLLIAALGVVGAAAQVLRPHAELAGASGEQASLRIGSTALMARDPSLRPEPAVVSTGRPLRDPLEIKAGPISTSTSTSTSTVAREAEHGKAAATALTRRASSRRSSSRNWLAMGGLASR